MIAPRLAILGTLVVTAVTVTVSPALADGLNEYLEEADQAVYSGRQFVSTTWDGAVAVDMAEVRHLGGFASVGSGPGHTAIWQAHGARLAQ